MMRLLAWIVAILLRQKHHKPGHKPQPGTPIAAAVSERVRVSASGVAQVVIRHPEIIRVSDRGMAQLSGGPEFVRVADLASALVSGPRPPVLTLAVSVGEIVRASAGGSAMLAREPELVRVADRGMAQLSGPVRVRVSDLCMALLTGPSPPSGTMAVRVSEVVRMTDAGAAQLVREPEIVHVAERGIAQLSGPVRVRVSDLCVALLTDPHAPIGVPTICDFCADEVRLDDAVTVRRV